MFGILISGIRFGGGHVLLRDGGVWQGSGVPVQAVGGRAGGELARGGAALVDREFSESRADPVSPVGKVLIIDKILDVARVGGEQRFADGQNWAAKFARCTALALGREMVRVDVPACLISY
jgi:hypothetical protein